MNNSILCIVLGLAGHPKSSSMWYATLLFLTTVFWSYSYHGYHTMWVWAMGFVWVCLVITYLGMAYCLGRLKQLGAKP